MCRAARSIRSTLPVLVCLAGSGFAAAASGDNGILLTCDRYQGEQEFEIYINEQAGYVLYNAQNRDGDYRREREYTVIVDGEKGGTNMVDEGIDIFMNNEQVIQAKVGTESFVLVKKRAVYAYASTMAFPYGDGQWAAVGTSHTGECSMNPFSNQ